MMRLFVFSEWLACLLVLGLLSLNEWSLLEPYFSANKATIVICGHST